MADSPKISKSGQGHSTGHEFFQNGSLKPQKAIKDYPETNAVIVRRHGIYVWGKTWQQAKAQAECIDYLCKMAVEMRKLGMDVTGGFTEV